MASVRRLLSALKGDIVRELDVARILPQLVHRKVFSAVEEREILSSADARFRADVFVERLASKGPDAFQEFCIALERHNPRLLTRFLLVGRLHENQDGSSSSPRAASHISTTYDEKLNNSEGGERMNRILQEDLDAARRQYNEMKERDDAFTMLENIRNQQRPVVKDVNLSGPHENSDLSHQTPSGYGECVKDWMEEGGEKIIWENLSVVLSRVPNYGFGIAVTGGKDNPQFVNGDPAIVVSDVLKGGPADGKLCIGDRIASVNNIPFDNIDNSTAISVLKDSGAMANLVIRRRFLLTPHTDFEQPFKVTLTKKNKKDDYGIVLGYKLYIKQIVPNGLAAHEGYLKEGDTIVKLNSSPSENLSLNEAQKQMDKSKEKLQLVVAKTSFKRTVENILPSSAKQSSLMSSRHLAGDAAVAPAAGPTGVEKSSSKPVNINNLDYPVGAHYPVSDKQFPRVDSSQPMRSNYQTMMPTDSLGRPLSNAAVSPLPSHAVPGRDYPIVPVDAGGYLPSIGAGLFSDHRPVVHDYRGSPIRNNEYNQQPAYPSDDVDLYRRPVPEPRLVSFRKDGGVGIRVSGGNRTGIFIARVAPNTPAERQGLSEGDLILKVNDVDMHGKTREEAVLLLLSLQDRIGLLVQRRQLEYECLMAEGGTGDLFYIRTHFNYDVTEHGELSFKQGDIFQITDTLYSGVVGSWQAIRVARTSQEAKKGIIPNLSRAEQLAVVQLADKENLSTSAKSSSRGSGFFKKKNAWRAKSLGHEHWDEAMFAGGKTQNDPHHRRPGARMTKYPAYERVLLRDVGFVRPVIILGPLADVAREKLIRDHPDWFELPQSDVVREGDRITKSGIIRLTAIREIVDRRKHAILDVTPHAVGRLNHAQYAPIVVYLKAESKHAVKDLRQHWAKNSSKSPRKLYEYGLRLEKSWSHLFTSTVALTNGELWYKKLKEVIEKAQLDKVWMSEFKPESSKDDVLFPMTRRLSFISSPESDRDATGHGLCSEDEADVVRSPYNVGRPPAPPAGTRLVRSSSDPSVGAADNIPGSGALYPSGAPVYSQDIYQPNQYRAEVPRANISGPTFGPPVRRDWASSVGFSDSRYLASRPNESPVHQGQISYSPKKYPPYSGRYQADHYYRSNIDPYATLTPSERIRFQPNIDLDGRYHDLFYGGRYPLDSSSGISPQHPISSLGTGSPQGAVDVLKMPPQPVAEANGSLYWTEPVQDDHRERLSGQPGYERQLAKDDPQYRPSLSSAKPFDQFPDYMPAGNIGYRSSDRLYNGQINSYDRKAPQDYHFDRHYPNNWRTKSETSLSQDHGLSLPSKRPALEIDRKPDGEVTERENLENILRNQYPYDSISRPNTGSVLSRDPLSERYSDSRSNLPPAKPPHVSYPKSSVLYAEVPHRVNDNHELPSRDRLPNPAPGLESFRTSDLQPKILVTKEDQAYCPREVDTFETKSSGKKQEQSSSAFESYRKPDNISAANSRQRDLSIAGQEDDHTIVATARGIFDGNGGTLESKETGVAIVIPKGAIPEGVKQEIYFKVCQDNNILPPLDKEKGETLLSPLVMCGPHGLKFIKPVELHLPHSASVNPESWSFALKSSDSPTGHPTQWQNIALAGSDGVSQGKVTKNSVTVLVDHF